MVGSSGCNSHPRKWTWYGINTDFIPAKPKIHKQYHNGIVYSSIRLFKFVLSGHRTVSVKFNSRMLHCRRARPKFEGNRSGGTESKSSATFVANTPGHDGTLSSMVLNKIPSGQKPYLLIIYNKSVQVAFGHRQIFMQTFSTDCLNLRHC